MGPDEGPSRAEEKHILIAVDGSENSKRAVLYVASLLGGLTGFRATLLNVIPEPPDEFFSTDEERGRWTAARRSEAEGIVEVYRTVLAQSGFEEGSLCSKVLLRRCPSVAECILDEVKKANACTVVLGRRGISRREEFLFGSTTERMLHKARNCAVWVVE